jgi:hypothetical protein
VLFSSPLWDFVILFNLAPHFEIFCGPIFSDPKVLALEQVAGNISTHNTPLEPSHGAFR